MSHQGHRHRKGVRSQQLRATQSGMVGADSVVCDKCSLLTTRDYIYKGWCYSCVAKWTDAADPWLVFQARDQYPSNVIRPSTIKQMDQLQERVVRKIKDDDLLPLTQFMGWNSFGHVRGMWNVLQAMYTFELETTSELTRLGKTCPNTMHLCGRHAPIQRMSLQGYLSRINSVNGGFKLFMQDKHLRDYIRGFVSDNRLPVFIYQSTHVNIYKRESQKWLDEKYGKAKHDRHSPMCWPFEGERIGKMREEGEFEELPDVVLQVGALVPVGLPQSLREDLCQDLCVAVLSGEVELEDLKIEKQMQYYIGQAFKHHPLKYGRFSLDQISAHEEHSAGTRKLVDLLADDQCYQKAKRNWMNDYDVEPDESRRGWHDGREREKGLTTVGELLCDKHDGHALAGEQIEYMEAEEMDEDIAEVYWSDQRPQWRRKLSEVPT